MSIRRILAPMTGGERDKVVLASAFAAAKPFPAHVVAMFVRPDPAEAMPFFGEGVSAVVVQEIVGVAKEAADKAAESARVALGAAAAASGIAILDKPARTGAVSVSFRETQGSFSSCVARESRLADLIVFGPLAESDNPGLTEAFEETLLESGRPVLLSAQVSPAVLGRNIAVACDGSVASAHAVSAALPYLKHADSIRILTVRSATVQKACIDDMREYLDLHGLSVSDQVVEQGQNPIGRVLLDAALGFGADMLVLGGYGHSRLRQFFGGGVTRHVVSHARLPVFMVH